MRMRFRPLSPQLLAALGIFVAASCSDDLVAPTAGSIEINTRTLGESQDGDGYTVAVDAGTPQTISASGTVTVPEVPAGTHQVRLDGIAGNCTATGENPRTVTVTAGSSSTVTFDITCPARRATSMIAFTSVRFQEGHEIHVMNTDGSGQKRLTNSVDEINRYPVWSPDGSRILFMSCEGGDAALHIMSADGSNQKGLGAANICDEMEVPDWSPDGMKIVYVRDIYLRVANADGTGRRRLTIDDSNYEHSPAWSPDGRRIVFVRGFDVQAINHDGTEPVQLTNEPTYTVPTPAWSPDGRKIAFVSGRDGNFEIYTMNADGSDQVRRTIAPDACPAIQPRDCGDRQPAWSPNGSKIVFTSDRHGDDEIYIMNADGTGEAQLTRSAGHDRRPEWSSDGSKIFFESNRDGNPEIYIMNADGSEQTNLTRSPAEDSDARAN